MPQLIPVPLTDGVPDPFFDFQASLDGVTYTLEFRWIVRGSFWFLTILNETADAVLVGSARVIVNFPMFSHTTPHVPSGALLFNAEPDVGADPSLTDLGVRVKLYYLTAAELGTAT